MIFDQSRMHNGWEDTCHFANGWQVGVTHDDVIKWKHFPRSWPFVRGIHRYPVNSPHKGQWRGALMFSLICIWINGWVNNRETGDLRRYRTHYDVTVMWYAATSSLNEMIFDQSSMHNGWEDTCHFANGWQVGVTGKAEPGIILGMDSANEICHYILRSSLVGWAHTQNDPFKANGSCAHLWILCVVIQWWGLPSQISRC